MAKYTNAPVVEQLQSASVTLGWGCSLLPTTVGGCPAHSSDRGGPRQLKEAVVEGFFEACTRRYSEDSE
jgi:hypothetical protein